MKYISSLLALGIITVFSSLALTEETTKKPMVFVCATQVEPPTTFAYIPGEVNLTPLMSWYSEYLIPGESAEKLCREVANKLQQKYDGQGQYFLAIEDKDDAWKVCLVTKEGQKCNASNSEHLFSLNINYKSPRCVMENIKPIQCPWSRGGLFSLPGGRYRPTWWPF